MIGFTFRAALTPLGEQKRTLVETALGTTVTTSAFFAYDCAYAVAYGLKKVLIDGNPTTLPWTSPVTTAFRLSLFSAILNNSFDGMIIHSSSFFFVFSVKF